MSSTDRRVLVIGRGGHARVCVEALLDDPRTTIAASVSTDGDDLPELMRNFGASHVFVAVGDNDARGRLLRRCNDLGIAITSAVSRHAMVSRSAVIGHGVALLPGAVVNAATVLHDGVIVNTNSSVDHDCTVGANTHIAPGCAIAGGVSVGDNVLIGIGARVLPGLRVGDGATVGAGSVVTRDVAPFVTVVGMPAGELPHGHD